MKKNIEIVMLGDSITGRGDWKNLLNNEHLINLGVDGDNLSLILSRLNRVLELEPKLVFFMAGINDLCISIPLDEVFENYEKILTKFKDKNIKVIVQATLLTQMPAVNKKVKVLNVFLKDYCQREKIKYIDLNNHFANEKGLLREDLTTDGLHLGQKAYTVWAYKLNKLLKS